MTPKPANRSGEPPAARPGPVLAPWPAMIALRAHLNRRVVAQGHVVQALVIALLADGHVLLEGPPGLAKTRVATTLAQAIEAAFQRIAFSPGLRIADLIGTFEEGEAPGGPPHVPGPVFANILLAEDIDQASPETRLALLDAMSERYVAGRGSATDLPVIFFVCATHALPVHHRGKQALTPAERDRFLMHLRMAYPDEAAERRILDMARRESAPADRPGPAPAVPMPLAVVLAAREMVRDVRLGPKMQRHITSLVAATRGGPPQPNDVRRWLAAGAGPRASIALERCARAHAWLAGRRQVTDRDVTAVARIVLRHRIQLSEAAEEAGVTADAVIDQLLGRPAEA
ncbi:MoxR family ATPase [Roseococcus sp. SYP-B2431]|uniref:AAA family ATPase n=1 Tax=Roseococcus sp. SYP-B2431 TaxID=2496640 RepID=UPI00104012C9|nr:MoxR family ATPase [Roseococcus sp. SYP-B2431]TCH98278.1 MoxR family ATPase [Roseococcus sp. SYP-B2431]